MFSAFFIRRPIFATVISLLIIIAGISAVAVLPVAQFPDIVPPQVMVTANYPGATAAVVEKTVATPLEEQINGVDGMLYMKSTSDNNGTLSLLITFANGVDPDMATVNVSNRVNQAQPMLPEEVRRQGVQVLKQSTNFLQLVSLYAPDGRYDAIYLSNYAKINVLDALKRIPGVSDAQIFGAKDYSMRIWLQPDKMAQKKITATDVANAIRRQNSQYAVGKIGQAPGEPTELTLVVNAPGRLESTQQFERIVVRADNHGAIVRLKDIARVELGSKDYAFMGRQNGIEAVPIGIFLQAGANALQTAKDVVATMDQLEARFPEGLQYDVPYDTTRFVEVSIHEVLKTLVEAMVLVFAVVYLFLQNWRATLIPCLAVPVSLIGTFAGMQLLGFSINTLTLFGMVLAIGIVVDDAIVVLENVERIMHEKMCSAREATYQAMQEVTGPVIAIVLVLSSVFIPVAFMGGFTGQLYKQFAITIALSVALSGLVALTLTPALCALLLKPQAQKGGFFLWFNRWFDQQTERYSQGVRWIIKRSGIAILLILAMFIAIGSLLRSVPSGFAPPEDQGYFIIAAQLPDGSSMHRTSEFIRQVDAKVMNIPGVDRVTSFSGYDLLAGGYNTAAAAIFVTLDDWSVRKEPELSVSAIINRVMAETATMGEGNVVAFNPPAIPGIGTTGGFDFYLQNQRGDNYLDMAQAANKLVAEAAKRPELVGVSAQFRANVPQLKVDLDREKARALGVPVNEVFDTLQSVFGELYVNDFNKSGRVYRVNLQAESDSRRTPEDISEVYVRAETGAMVPLGALVKVRHEAGPENVVHYNGFTAVNIIGQAAPGYSSGQAMAIMESLADQHLPDGYSYSWSSLSYQEKMAGSTQIIAFAMGLLMVFLILAAQYERWSLPFAVITAVPFAVFGALLAVWLRGIENDVYFQIGLVTLIGLAAKNAILIVEFAIMQRAAGLSPVAAAVEAAKLRFRPIIMTSLAFILGVVPLAISSGAGAASRHSIGTGVIGGMLAATLIAIFFIPLFFCWLEKGKKKTADNQEVAIEKLA